MSEERSGIQVGEQGGVILVRIEGKGTHLNSHLLKQYFLQCLNENHRFFKIDLSNCTYMDSTFLGMLAGIGIKVKERSFSPIKLINAIERVRSMFESLGIDSLFEIIQKDHSSAPLNHLQGAEINEETRSREMLEAHEKLVEISPSNEAKFRDVIGLLRKKPIKNRAI